uniref:Putative secreted protein n=1 Tax=Ixodes ricinus TaxID=34613 RepID=A0A147BCM3_IXORI
MSSGGVGVQTWLLLRLTFLAVGRSDDADGNAPSPWRTAVSAFLGLPRPHLRSCPSLPPLPPPHPPSPGTPPAGSRVGEGISGAAPGRCRRSPRPG